MKETKSKATVPSQHFSWPHTHIHTPTSTHPTQMTCLFTNQRWLAPFHRILESLSNKVDTLLARHGVPDQKRENADTLLHTMRTAITPPTPSKRNVYTLHKTNPKKHSNKKLSLVSPHRGYSVLLRKGIWTFHVKQRQTEWDRQVTDRLRDRHLPDAIAG